MEHGKLEELVTRVTPGCGSLGCALSASGHLDCCMIVIVIRDEVGVPVLPNTPSLRARSAFKMLQTHLYKYHGGGSCVVCIDTKKCVK